MQDKYEYDNVRHCQCMSLRTGLDTFRHKVRNGKKCLKIPKGYF